MADRDPSDIRNNVHLRRHRTGERVGGRASTPSASSTAPESPRTSTSIRSSPTAAAITTESAATCGRPWPRRLTPRPTGKASSRPGPGTATATPPERGYPAWVLQAITGKSASDFSRELPRQRRRRLERGLSSSCSRRTTRPAPTSWRTTAYAVVGYNPSSSNAVRGPTTRGGP